MVTFHPVGGKVCFISGQNDFRTKDGTRRGFFCSVILVAASAYLPRQCRLAPDGLADKPILCFEEVSDGEAGCTMAVWWTIADLLNRKSMGKWSLG